MVKTYNDLILECDGFGYSKEYYEMMKEASEIDLMDIYLSNQEFMVENADLITESGEILDGYFQEAVDDKTKNGIKQQANAKKGNLFKRIWNKILAVLRAIKNFFIRFGKNLKSRFGVIATANKLLAAKGTMKKNPKVAEVYKAFNSRMNTLATYIFTFETIRDEDGVVENEYIKYPLWQYIRTFASGKVRVQRKNNTLATTPSNLAKMMKSISKNDPKKARSIYKKISDTDIIDVPWVEGSLEKAISDINESIDQVYALNSSAMEVINNEESDAVSVATARTSVELLSDALTIGSDTMTLYSNIDKIVKCVTEYAQKVIDADRTSKEEDAAYNERDKQNAAENKTADKQYQKSFKKQKRAVND